jgi:hypothetical protein
MGQSGQHLLVLSITRLTDSEKGILPASVSRLIRRYERHDSVRDARTVHGKRGQYNQAPSDGDPAAHPS